MTESPTPAEILRFHLEAGADEAIGEAPVNRFRESPPPRASGLEEQAAPPPALPPAPSLALSGAGAAPGPATDPVQSAYELAAAASSIPELKAAMERFEGCALKATATNLVFGDGNPDAPIVFIGEAPGAEEDRRGLPFVGPSGRLLDRMLATIGIDRTGFFITNTVFWRPPGNRNPSTAEIAVCMPFVERIIELVDPEVLVAVGGPAAKALLAQDQSVGKLRGRWFPYATPRMARPAQATAIYHPAYLLRTPEQKKVSWRDLLDIRRKLDAARTR
jgi:DNA polymerase